ncbi:hypothetical protein EV651_1139 [Kribbella sp. VKM Ac-2571]|uniref:hypothetical protein n=1 Tax=Kribbella sp. VKM Ac-2571 TaxID=2512222 RepID=UPI0010610019|nr:hypothetical protein [Kribbella sp. VKM Ac-2571]TDO55984.1 hypothetical protein EV651_1139 [Kribbella sp. VKM Ac-2571]
MTEHPGEQFPPDVDPDVEPGFDPYQSEETQSHPDYDTEPGAQDAAQETAQETVRETAEHVDPAAVEFGPEFARAPGQEYEHSFEAGSAEDPAYEEPASDESTEEGGHPLVEETMARLDELREKPVSEHGEVYADLHERLQTALVEADAEQGDRN